MIELAAVLNGMRGRVEAAEYKVHRLCHGDETWRMSIPARPDSDPDLVIGAALRDAARALDALEERTGLAQAQEERLELSEAEASECVLIV